MQPEHRSLSGPASGHELPQSGGLFDPLPGVDRLAVALMASGSPVDGRATAGLDVLRHMRRDPGKADVGDKVPIVRRDALTHLAGVAILCTRESARGRPASASAAPFFERPCMASPVTHAPHASLAWLFRWALAGALAASPAAATPLAAQVKGLPAGLSVLMSFDLARCQGNGVQFVPAGTVPLAETTFATWERVTVPFARVPRLQRITRSQYEGTLNVNLPTSNGCSQNTVPVGSGRRIYRVLGQTPEGLPGQRTAVIATNLDGRGKQVSDTISARTTQMIRNQQRLTTLAIGAENDLSTGFSNSFGSEAITRPVLELQRQGQFPNALGLGEFFGTVVRFSLTDDLRACVLVVGSGSQCRPLQEGGTLQVGSVSLNLSRSNLSSALSGPGRSMRWVFSLANGFPTQGTWRVVARAEDADTIDPLVDGQARSLDLLPWTPLAVPVTFTSP